MSATTKAANTGPGEVFDARPGGDVTRPRLDPRAPASGTEFHVSDRRVVLHDALQALVVRDKSGA